MRDANGSPAALAGRDDDVAADRPVDGGEIACGEAKADRGGGDLPAEDRARG